MKEGWKEREKEGMKETSAYVAFNVVEITEGMNE